MTVATFVRNIPGLNVCIWQPVIVMSISYRFTRLLQLNGDIVSFFPHAATAPSGPGPHCQAFTITLRHTTLGRTPLDEQLARRKYLYLTTHNTHNRQTSMPPAGFEPSIPASERTQTHALDSAATGIGEMSYNRLWLIPRSLQLCITAGKLSFDDT
jgi:hypothetical protein